MVQLANEWFVNRNYSTQVSAAGATDIETGFNTFPPTKDWVDGYQARNQPYPYFNNGDAGGCPEYTTGGNCNNGWSVAEVHYVSAIPKHARAVPQIYLNDGTMARQWQRISLYGYLNRGGNTVDFVGSLTQYGTCQQPGRGCGTTEDNTAGQGWTQLRNQLNSDSRTAQRPRWSTDIRWYPD